MEFKEEQARNKLIKIVEQMVGDVGIIQKKMDTFLEIAKDLKSQKA